MNKLLIIDDRRSNLIAFEAIATQHLPGVEVQTALGGPGGLAAAQAWLPDVILLDVAMPDIDGYAICERLKGSEATAHIAVLLITAQAPGAAERAAGLDRGAYDYLVKPIDGVELAARVRGALRTKKSSDEQQRQTAVARREQARSEEHYRTIFDTVPDAIITIGPDRRISDCNPQACAMFGYTYEELIGLPLVALVPVEGRSDAIAHSMAMLAQRQQHAVERQLLRKDGGRVDIEARATTLGESDGATVGVLCVLRDVSARKRAEADRVRLEQQLTHAQRMEAIAVLAGGVAHDFNNLLVPIIGYTDALLLSCQNEGERGDLEQIKKAGQRARKLATRLLSFSRRKQDEPMQLVALAPIVREVLALLRASLPASITLETALDNEDTVMANPSQLHQLIMNLCINAYQAMADGPGLLGVAVEPFEPDADWLRTHSDLSAGSYLRLTVSDQGHGMDADTRERIFEPFFSTKGEGEGTGLGLGVVQGVVARHHGAIAVQSEPGSGSTFEVFLPLASG